MKTNSLQNRLPFGQFLKTFAFLLPALGWLAGGGPARAETITGTFRYADLNPADGTVVLRPIQFCAVEIWGFRPRFAGIWGWAKARPTALRRK